VSDTGKERERRPYLASECLDLPKAEKWRMQIIREIAKKVAQIQNGTLSSLCSAIVEAGVASL
jgi:pre-mRNA-splicing factor ISY1